MSDLGAIRKYWKEATLHPDFAHIPLVLAGTFKGETGLKLFCQPLSSSTKDGRELAVWFGRYIMCLELDNTTTGPLFRTDDGKRMGVAQLDVLFHSLLLEVQRRFPTAIPDSVKVEEVYSTFRSLRRGATSEAQNVGIPGYVIESNNRWRKWHRARGMTPGFGMMQHYTDAQVAVPTLIRFSSELPS